MTALPCRIFLLSHNALDHTLTFGIGTKRWEYYLTPSQCDTAQYFARRFGPRKALAYAKRWANKTEVIA